MQTILNVTQKGQQTCFLILSVNICFRCPPTTISAPKTGTIAASANNVNVHIELLESFNPYTSYNKERRIFPDINLHSIRILLAEV